MIHYIDKKTTQHKQYFRTYKSCSHILEYFFMRTTFEVALMQSQSSSVNNIFRPSLGVTRDIATYSCPCKNTDCER